MKRLLTGMALGLVALTSQAITPLWMRDAQISPDGSTIAFCYKGDIYKVSTQGGAAVQLTTQASFECNPIWSPDSKHIAFASDRDGNFDIFIMSVAPRSLPSTRLPNTLRLSLPTASTWYSRPPFKTRLRVFSTLLRP